MTKDTFSLVDMALNNDKYCPYCDGELTSKNGMYHCEGKEGCGKTFSKSWTGKNGKDCFFLQEVEVKEN